MLGPDWPGMQRILEMPKHRNLLIVLADGEHARFVRPGPHESIHPDPAFDPVNKLSADPGSHTGSSEHRALTPEYDPHSLEKQKFAQHIAIRLNHAAAQGAFNELVIVAPPHTMSGIRDHLDSTTAPTVVGTLAKDLVKTPDHELWPHLRPCIPLAPRVIG